MIFRNTKFGQISMNKSFRYLKNLIKKFVYKHTKLKSNITYPYLVEPIQLAQIIIELERLKKNKR